jgi:recombination protein RecA
MNKKKELINEIKYCILEEKTSISEVSRRTKLTRRTIVKWMKQEGILNKNAWIFKSPDKISKIQLQVLRGTILGDDCIYLFKGCKNPRLLVYHSIAQKKYAELKLQIWKNLVFTDKLKISKRKKGTRVHFATTSHKDFLPIYNATYVYKKKTITAEFLETLTPLSLAFWFQDDGSRCKNRGLAIHTNCFSLEEVEICCSFLKNRYSIKCNPQQRKKNQYVIFFSNATSKNFAEMILPWVHPSMRYKLEGIYPKNPQRPYAVPFKFENLKSEDMVSSA